MSDIELPTETSTAPFPSHESPSIYDDEGDVREAFVREVAAAIEAGSTKAVCALAGELHEADLGALIEALSQDLRPRLIELMGHDFDFAALTEVDDKIRDEILEELPVRMVAEGVQDLEYDDAVSLLEDLNKHDQAEILDALSAVDRAALKRSLDFPEESAGRLMQTTLVTAPPFWTAGQAIDFMRDTDEEDLPDVFFEVFIVDPTHRLLGNVFLDTLLRAKSTVRLEEIMLVDRRRVSVLEDREEVARMFER